MGMKKIELKIKDYIVSPHPGFGRKWEIRTTIFYCPCGKGEVRYVKDDIPGFRDKEWFLDCEECSKKYDFDYHTGEMNIKEEKQI